MNRDYPDRPIVGVGVVVFRDDKGLLIRRSKPPKSSAWSLPGGAQELGETVEEAAHREVREETGLEIELIGLIDVVNFIDRDGNGDTAHHYTLVDFAAISAGGDLKPGDDADGAEWFDLDELDELDLWSETVRIIREAAKVIETRS